jgi:FkbM family methyltransferase
VTADRIGQRTPTRVVRALLQPRHYRSALAAVAIVRRPLSFLARYALGLGRYPSTVELKTPIGIVRLVVNSWHDLRTIHEIFCAGDYRAGPADKIIVDYGSNIGVSAAYFLSRSTDSFAYLFEPLPRNLDTLKVNLQQFRGRYELEEVAVGLENGRMEFGWEPTGRYGGLGRQTGNYITVDVRRSNDILDRVIAARHRIDILKIDIETLERELTEDISQETAARIGTVVVEYRFDGNALATTHDMTAYGTISRFTRKEPS